MLQYLNFKCEYYTIILMNSKKCTFTLATRNVVRKSYFKKGEHTSFSFSRSAEATRFRR